jgi:hypothetical protein
MNANETTGSLTIFVIRGFITVNSPCERTPGKNGNHRAEREASLPLLTEQEKEIFRSEISRHFTISEGNLRLFDGPLTILVRDVNQNLCSKKEINQFMLIVVTWLQRRNYFQPNHRVNVSKISRSEGVTKFFYEYYNNAGTALEELNHLDSNTKVNLLGSNYGLVVFVPLDFNHFHECLADFVLSYSEIIKCVLFYSSKYNYFYFLFTMDHPASSDRVHSALLNCELISSLNISVPPSLFTTNEEINEQLFQSMNELVLICFLVYSYFFYLIFFIRIL